EVMLLQKFRYNYRDYDDVVIPKVKDKLSSDTLIVMEYIKGKPLAKSSLDEKESEEVSKLLINVIIRQILKDGIFHADPHPGNILYTEDGEISYLDFGMVGRLSRKMRNQLIDLLEAVRSSEPEWILQEIIAISENEIEVDTETLVREIMEIKDRYIGVSVKDISVGKAFLEIFDLVRRYKILINPGYTYVGKAIFTTEETIRNLSGDLNIWKAIEPQLKKLYKARFAPKNIWKDFKMLAKTASRFIGGFPEQARVIMKKLKTGKLEIEFRHMGLENLIKTLDRISNRLSFSLIISALIVASSLIIQIEKGPMLLGISAFGLVGYLFATLLGVWLLWSILKSGRL
ncbi:MAG: ABC1 kinase family protein, partial [Elusimicrobiota bacterium]